MLHDHRRVSAIWLLTRPREVAFVEPCVLESQLRSVRFLTFARMETAIHLVNVRRASVLSPGRLQSPEHECRRFEGAVRLHSCRGDAYCDWRVCRRTWRRQVARLVLRHRL